VEALRAAGLAVWVSDVRSVDDSLREIEALGRAVGRPESAAALLARVEESLRAVSAARRAEVPVYVPIWRRPWMTLTRDTYAHHVLAVAGARNVFAEQEGRYPERGPEEAIEAGARAALLPTEPYPFHEKLAAAKEELLEAGFPEDRIRVIDGEALTWYGARAPEGIRAIGDAVRKL
jgi:ABC-type Fe3+-hydroxamate transport system substrate-binding protein